MSQLATCITGDVLDDLMDRRGIKVPLAALQDQDLATWEELKTELCTKVDARCAPARDVLQHVVARAAGDPSNEALQQLAQIASPVLESMRAEPIGVRVGIADEFGSIWDGEPGENGSKVIGDLVTRDDGETQVVYVTPPSDARSTKLQQQGKVVGG